MSDDKDVEKKEVEKQEKPASATDKYTSYIDKSGGYKSIFQSDNIGMGKDKK